MTADRNEALKTVFAHLERDSRPGAIVVVGGDGDGVSDGVRALFALASGAGMKDRRLIHFAENPTSADGVEATAGLTREIFRGTRTGAIACLIIGDAPADVALGALRGFYHRLSPGGALIALGGHAAEIADWFAGGEGGERAPLLLSPAAGALVGLRPPLGPPPPEARYDHAPPGYADPGLIPAFPALMETDPGPVGWPWLRKNSPHIWRTDGRAAKKWIGVLSYEEALTLHNHARLFRGEPALEIGCHLAWSTAHLLAAGLKLDVVDPALGDHDHRRCVEDSLASAARRAPVWGEARLYAGFSPDVIGAVAAARGAKYAFAFIDGWHDDDGPMRDARAVEPLMAANALVMFHDLLCPAVAAGLKVFADAGWNWRIMETSQIMACAWRGSVAPPAYQPDPNMPRSRNPHLAALAGGGA